ncbi:zinc ribbon domain-containing protein [bacterium]|nr:zinc ribbon domain-containing protein [candidate division CSSED10-310 bacterium]
MPMYEFRCQSCHVKFEKLVRGAAEQPHCPDCDSHSVKKCFSAFGFKSSGAFIPSSGATCGGCTSHSCSTCNS